MLRLLCARILQWITDWLYRPVRRALQAEAKADTNRRRTAGEIAAEAADRQQQQYEDRINNTSGHQKLDELRRRMGSRWNTWL